MIDTFRSVVRAVVGTGKTLGIETTAEGVETRDQLSYLKIEGCAEIEFLSHQSPPGLRGIGHAQFGYASGRGRQGLNLCRSCRSTRDI